MASTSGYALDSKQICEKFHDDMDSFSETSQDSDIDVTEHNDPDAKINGPDLSGSDGNSDDDQASGSGGDGGDDDSGSGGGDNDEDIDTEDWTLCDKNDHDFLRYHFVLHLVIDHLKTDKYLFLQMIFFYCFSATSFKEIAAENDRYINEKNKLGHAFEKNICFGSGGKMSQLKSWHYFMVFY
jgi:hypothetical protein